MQRHSRPLSARFKFVFFVLVNVVIALLGTAFSESAIWNLFPSLSLSGVLWKESALSLFCAGCVGVSVHRIWKTSAAQWTWVLPSLWLLLRILTLSSSTGSPTYLHHRVTGSGIRFLV